MKKSITLILFLIIITIITTNIVEASPNKNLVNIYLFHSNTCSHCKEEIKFLKQLEEKYKNIKIYKYEIHKEENYELLTKVSDVYDININGVPITIIGNKVYNGYSNQTNITFIKTIEYFSRYGYKDEIGELLNLELPKYEVKNNDVLLDEFINNYKNYKLLDFNTDSINITIIPILIGISISFNILFILGYALILLLNKNKDNIFLELFCYIILNTILLLVNLINNIIISSIIYILLINIFIYILINKKEYKYYNNIILISTALNVLITYLNNKYIVIFKEILELHSLIGIDSISYYNSCILTYFIINFIVIYIINIITNNKSYKHT